MGHSELSGRTDQIKSELGRLFNEQAAFFKTGNRAAHTNTEIAEYEKRRERIRELFAELDELRKTRASILMNPFSDRATVRNLSRYP